MILGPNRPLPRCSRPRRPTNLANPRNYPNLDTENYRARLHYHPDDLAHKRFRLLVRALTDRGIVDPVHGTLADHGLKLVHFLDDTADLTRFLTVRSLDHWPIS